MTRNTPDDVLVTFKIIVRVALAFSETGEVTFRAAVDALPLSQ